jgi:leucyl aminopeptidase (aminopeptidase T)
MATKKLIQSAHKAIIDYMCAKAKESILVIADENTRNIGITLYEAGRDICKESFYVEMKKRDLNGQEPPIAITEMMQKVDMVICATTRSLTHTNARRMATEKGVRVGTMPGITEEIIQRCFSADSKEIIKTNNKLIKQLDNAKEIKLTSAIGTNATFSAVGRKILSSTGVMQKKGDWGNIPSGEVYFAPVEDMSEGVIVCDGSIAGIGMLTSPVTINIKNGMITKISGGEQAKILNKMLSEVGGKAKAVAEFGIGTNPKAKICGLILEDEKVKGTVHIAFGNNVSMGGRQDVGIHIDCIIKSPSFVVDGKTIMNNGKLLINSK